MTNHYRDSEERFNNDPDFHHLVSTLEGAAVAYGFTPGELKQAAFYAALRVEMLQMRPIIMREFERNRP